jgi:hypothetical protein
MLRVGAINEKAEIAETGLFICPQDNLPDRPDPPAAGRRPWNTWLCGASLRLVSRYGGNQPGSTAGGPEWKGVSGLLDLIETAFNFTTVGTYALFPHSGSDPSNNRMLLSRAGTGGVGQGDGRRARWVEFLSPAALPTASHRLACQMGGDSCGSIPTATSARLKSRPTTSCRRDTLSPSSCESSSPEPPSWCQRQAGIATLKVDRRLDGPEK